MRPKLNYQFVKEYFEKHGCALLETEWVGCEHKMQYVCKCGNNSKTTWHNFKRGHRCCGKKDGNGNKRHKHEDVAAYFASHNCKILDQYLTDPTPVRYICECGNEDKIRFSKFKMGQRCRKCKYEKIGKKMKLRKGPLNPRWNPDRQQVKFNKMLHQKFQSLVNNVLAAKNLRKNCRSEKLLGYTRKQLKHHLINHPDWIAVKNGKWSIDHIFPIKAFVDHGIHDIKLINCLENLRPMNLRENISKSGKYSETEFLEWLGKHSV